MEKLFTFGIAFILSATVLMAQETTGEFKPGGKPAVTIFSNAHTVFVDETNTSAFELQRAYLGYEYAFSTNFSTKILFDVGNPESGKLQMTAYVKNALLNYKTDKLNINFGLIGLYHFNLQEKNFGYRYIMKPYIDEYGFGTSADLGASIEYRFTDFISADFTVMNGEGFKKLQSDETYKAGLGITVTPVKNLDLRVYSDYMKQDFAQQGYAFFAGYKADKFRVGTEYNMQKNHDMIENQDYSGISMYSTISIGKKFGIFGRFDHLKSETLEGADNSWNYSKDGQAYIVGFEYNPVKGVKLAPNFRGWNPADESKGFISSIYLNCEIKF
ncbi:MAG: hypothetical protein A2X13_03455 [Bacteroidetes bacterium GWC2_33_15]|nr:MAG: hypothetical protein A2X10_13070 [Bacteroidetes bacterium GWA2_33_15]OFX51665.1 MAG: hypothetical protein A2X13_03455 [Bacteroidetes bacterium GWC2_33_15]OFX66273.1 MAG: hypothetical protein A2X15_14490 [Bacteroidetes bacterium GWB2_32_14]OFX66965.1 MAG: hypothetical protein A2X14_00615 [Bacteroidetes bacterium GWD2_33_33]HAN17663.1 hypothetical protein [Bacteroidales bacterium]